MAGRPATPTSLKIIKGNPGKRAISKREPKPEAASTDCPSWLTGTHARKFWGRVAPQIAAMRVFTASDVEAVCLMCEAYQDYRDARHLLAEGRTYETETSNGAKKVSAHPAVADAADAWRRVRAMMVEFGLTPASRTKVSASDADEVDPMESFLAIHEKATPPPRRAVHARRADGPDTGVPVRPPRV